jgi:hypothetical protein
MKVKTKNAARLFFSGTSLEYVYFEAIANSIDAEATLIELTIRLSSFTEPESLSVTIQDNGTGFNDASFERFSNLLDRSDDQHKGIGRLAYLSYFEEIFVNSCYGKQKRSFIFNSDFDGDSTLEDLHEEDFSTTVELKGYSRDRVHSYNYISHAKLKQSIFYHFLPRLYQLKLDNKALEIIVRVETDQPSPEHQFFGGSSCIKTSDLPELREKVVPDNADLIGEFRLLYSVELGSESKSIVTALCADNRTLPIKIVSESNFPEGCNMIFILYSDYFNGKTNATREAFTFDEPVRKRIKRVFTHLVSEVIKEEIPEIEERNSSVQESLQQQYPHLVGYFDEPSIGLADKHSIVEGAQYKFFADQKEILEAEELSDEQYDLSLNFSSRVLTEYILYRSKIIQKLKEMGSGNHEKEIHNLIVPQRQILHRNQRVNDIFLNNAWVLDDKYMSYTKVLSDIEIERIYTELGTEGSHEYSERETGRPDVTIIFSRDPEYTDIVDVVIVELKKLGLDLARKEEIISQLRQRARRLLELYPDKIQRMWFYGIIDFDDELLASLDEDGYIKLFSEGEVFYKKQPIVVSRDPLIRLHADIFLLSYQTMLRDAEVRNSTFLSLLKEGLKGNLSV